MCELGAVEVTWAVQTVVPEAGVPEAQAPTMVPDSLTMSRYQGVGPMSRAALATSVTAAPGAAAAALALSPVRQTPSVEQPPLPPAPPTTGVAVAASGVLVAWTGVLVGVLVAPAGVLIGGTGVLVAVLGGADEDQVTATELVLGPPPVMPWLLVLSQAV